MQDEPSDCIYDMGLLVVHACFYFGC